MSSRSDVEKGLLVYTCNCGWVDKNHAAKSTSRANVGAKSLWSQVQGETGWPSRQPGERNGYKVTYRQDMGRSVAGKLITTGVEREYFVASGLKLDEKERVALAIFAEVSVAFESYQNSWPFGWISNSGFSQEDLVSDLLSFYAVVRPSVKGMELCQAVSAKASLAIWDRDGPVGNSKSKTFKPIFHPCDECGKKPGIFPSQLERIVPAPKGTLFRDWTPRDTYGSAWDLIEKSRDLSRQPKW